MGKKCRAVSRSSRQQDRWGGWKPDTKLNTEGRTAEITDLINIQ